MRQKIKFPHRSALVEREVHHDHAGNYIVSCGFNVPVVLFDGVWTVAPGWEWVFKKEGTK